MKKLNLSFLVTLIFVFVASVQAQDDCKVLVPELSGSYVGKCKRGFAHGKGKAIGKDTYVGSFRKGLPNGGGTYTWASGATYKGDWVYGMREGEGVYKFKYKGKDSIQSGIWDGDVYKGKKVLPPHLIYKEFVTSYSFRRDGNGDRILIDLKLNGQPNIDILDFSIISTSGTAFELGRSHGIQYIDFPVIVKVKYISWNAANTSRHSATFEFEIYEAGNWQVNVTN